MIFLEQGKGTDRFTENRHIDGMRWNVNQIKKNIHI